MGRPLLHVMLIPAEGTHVTADMPFLPYDLGPGMRSTCPVGIAVMGPHVGGCAHDREESTPSPGPPKLRDNHIPELRNAQVSVGQSGLKKQTAIIQVLIFFN